MTLPRRLQQSMVKSLRRVCYALSLGLLLLVFSPSVFAGITPIFTDDLETFPELWTRSSTNYATFVRDLWRWGAPSTPTGPGTAFNGTNCWTMVCDMAYNPLTQSNVDAWVSTPDIYVGVNPVIQFAAWFKLEKMSVETPDVLYVEAYDGTTWTNVTPGGSYSGVSADWQTETIALDNARFGDRTIRIRFRFISVPPRYATTRSEAYIDALKVSYDPPEGVFVVDYAPRVLTPSMVNAVTLTVFNNTPVAMTNVIAHRSVADAGVTLLSPATYSLGSFVSGEVKTVTVQLDVAGAGTLKNDRAFLLHDISSGRLKLGSDVLSLTVSGATNLAGSKRLNVFGGVVTNWMGIPLTGDGTERTTLGAKGMVQRQLSATEFTSAPDGARTNLFGVNRTVFVRVMDMSMNTNALAVDHVTVAVANTTTGDVETVVLAETSFNAGIFTGSVPASVSAGATTNDGTLHARETDVLRLSYADPGDSADTSADMATIARSFTEFTLGLDGVHTNVFATNQAVSVRVTDLNSDTDSLQTNNVIVVVTNVTLGDWEYVTLSETALSSGIFTGAIPAKAFGAPGTINNGTLFAPDGTGIQVIFVDINEWRDMSYDAAIILGSTTRFIAGLGGVSTNAYAANATVTVRVTDTTRNTNMVVANNLLVSVSSVPSGDMETFILTETGLNTGVFEGSVASSDSSGGSSEDGTLYAPEGSILTASYADMVNSNDTSSASATIPKSSTEFISLFNGAHAIFFAAYETVGVRVSDGDRNLNALALDSVTVVVTNSYSHDSETVTLDETAMNSGVFTGSVPVAISGSVINNNGIMNAPQGSTLLALYVDAGDTNDTSSDTATVPPTALASCFYQIIDAGPDGKISPPATNGTPTGDDILLYRVGEFSSPAFGRFGDGVGCPPDGGRFGNMFKYADTIPFDRFVYARAWDSENFVTAVAYGDSVLKLLSTTEAIQNVDFGTWGVNIPISPTNDTDGDSIPDGYCVVKGLDARLPKDPLVPGMALEKVVGTGGNGPGQFSSPVRVIKTDRYLFVLDKNNSRLQTWSATNLTYIGFLGTNAVFSNPCGLAADPRNGVYRMAIADTENNRVCVYSYNPLTGTNWTWLFNIGSKTNNGNKAGQLYKPSGVAIGTNGYIYVANTRPVWDAANSDIQVFSDSGSYVTNVVDYPAVDRPVDIAVTTNDMRYVADTDHQVIRVFDASNTLVWSAGIAGSFSAATNAFNTPRGIQNGRADRVYVADTLNHRLKIYDRNGTLKLVAGQAGTDPGYLNTPWDVYPATNDNRIYVADTANNRVQIFKVFLDDDGDGMDDVWEEANGRNSSSNDADQAWGVDGLSNIGAYRLGLSGGQGMDYAVVTLIANPPSGGVVGGAGSYIAGTPRVITATTNTYWGFVGWNDGNSSTSRTIIVPAAGITYVATFNQEQGVITVSNIPPEGGLASGGGVYSVGSSQPISATPTMFWRFVQWTDGNSNNPRSVVVTTAGSNYVAQFEKEINPILISTIKPLPAFIQWNATNMGIYRIEHSTNPAPLPTSEWVAVPGPMVTSLVNGIAVWTNTIPTTAQPRFFKVRWVNAP